MKKIKISSPDSNVLGCAFLELSIAPRKSQNAKIVSIDLLEGEQAQTGTVIQYVNLKREERFVDSSDIIHIDRLGQKLRCKVSFNQAGTFRFKVKLTPGTDNVTYSANEIGRNPNFQYSVGEIEFTTDSNGEKIIEADKLFVSPAGNDTFSISATDEEGNEVTASANILTKRMIYYIEANMEGISVSDISTVIGEYEKHGITMKKITSIAIPHRYNVDGSSEEENEAFTAELQALFSTSAEVQAKSPYCLLFTFTETSAMRESQNLIAFDIEGGSQHPVRLDAINPQANLRSPLWNGINPNEDWFIECYFVEDGGSYEDKIPINRSKLSVLHFPDAPPEFCPAVNVDISELPPVTGALVLRADCLLNMCDGYAMQDYPFVIIPKKSWWVEKSAEEQNQTLIHEVGHMLHMVTDGKASLPDKTPYHYTNKGHTGPHCHNGLPDDMENYMGYGKYAKCVMFGSPTKETAFCPECAIAVRKLDLSGGYHGHGTQP